MYYTIQSMTACQSCYVPLGFDSSSWNWTLKENYVSFILDLSCIDGVLH